ncbi:nuclear transport factor 2 family protein [Nocardioides sp. SLBN-35]|uniref:nuclear transport factor 2 family protein n=1 Tax=Nocardioides sp. SLBN-35 TaxID=2768445 RepID=UPI00114EEC14|nr:nuclear transport factor 2 family protein [Nocardioides sp. SLBN-35]TQK69261.1 SnoaL-like protein [Nocardioides sp. SLBN-35]
MDVQQLIDRAEIADAITRYTLAVDEGDFDRLDTVFTPDAQIDYTESGGVADAFPVVKAWLAEALPGFSTHRIHMLGQISYQFVDDGNEAAVAAYFHNPMRIRDGKGGERVVEVGGLYRHTFVRTADGWRSRRLHEQVVWTRGF